MPWTPELFTAPALQRLQDELRRDELVAVPYFEGFLAGEPDALVESFAGEPLLYEPVRGRVQGAPAFRAFIAMMSDWLQGRNASMEHVDHLRRRDGGFEEVIVHLDGEAGRIAVPHAIRGVRGADARLEEMRVYYSNEPLRARHASRSPLLQPDPELDVPDLVAGYQGALAAGDVEGIVAAFEPDGFVEESSGAQHRGRDDLRTFYDRMFAHGGGVEQEHCAIIGDDRVTALEGNVVRWGSEQLLPQAGMAVFVRGEGGRLAAVRVYDDVEPPR